MTPDSPDAAVPGPPEQGDWWIPAHTEPEAAELGHAGSGEAGSGRAGSGEGTDGRGSQPLVIRLALAAKVGVLGAACAVVAGAFAVAAHQSDAPTDGALLGALTPTPTLSSLLPPSGSPTGGPDRFDPWSQPLVTPSVPVVATPPRSPVQALGHPGAPAVVAAAPRASTASRPAAPVRNTPAAGGARRSHQASGQPVAVNPPPVRKPTKCRGAAPACAAQPGPVTHWPPGFVSHWPPGLVAPGTHPPHPPWPPQPSFHGPQAWKPPGQVKKPGFGPPQPHPTAPHPGGVSTWLVQAISSGLAHGPLPGGHHR